MSNLKMIFQAVFELVARRSRNSYILLAYREISPRAKELRKFPELPIDSTTGANPTNRFCRPARSAFAGIHYEERMRTAKRTRDSVLGMEFNLLYPRSVM